MAAALVARLMICGGVTQAQAPLLDVPVIVFRWKSPPSHESPLVELQLRHADEIALTVIHPEPPLLTVERACGKPDLFYSPADRTIVLCREMGPFVQSLSAELARDADHLAVSGHGVVPADTGFLIFLILHEAGHALIHQIGFPVIGGSEEAADGFATWMLLHKRRPTPRPWFADDSTANALRVMDAALMFSQLQRRADRASSGQRTAEDFIDEHPMPGQRSERLWCYSAGRNPNRARWSADQAYLAKCEHSWKELDYSWRRLMSMAFAKK